MKDLFEFFDLTFTEVNLRFPLSHSVSFTLVDILNFNKEINTVGNPNLTIVITFMKTLSESAISTVKRWKDPFRG